MMKTPLRHWYIRQLGKVYRTETPKVSQMDGESDSTNGARRRLIESPTHIYVSQCHSMSVNVGQCHLAFHRNQQHLNIRVDLRGPKLMRSTSTPTNWRQQRIGEVTSFWRSLFAIWGVTWRFFSWCVTLHVNFLFWRSSNGGDQRSCLSQV